MKLLKFIFQKILIIEVMIIILSFICNLFNINIPIIDLILNSGLTYLTPVAVVSLIGYIILSLLSFKIVEIAIGVILGGIVLYYIFS